MKYENDRIFSQTRAKRHERGKCQVFIAPLETLPRQGLGMAGQENSFLRQFLSLKSLRSLFFVFFTFNLISYNTYYLITLLTKNYTLLLVQYHVEQKL